QPEKGERSAEPATPVEAFVELGPGEARRGVVLGADQEALTGTVGEEGGGALEGLTVRISAVASGEVLAVARTDGEGRFRPAVGGAGPFRVAIDDAQLKYESSVLEPVSAGDELAIVLREFHSPFTIRGALLPESGALPENVFVAFRVSRTQEQLARVAIPES